MNKKLIGFVLIVASLAFMGMWEFWGRQHIAYEDVLVLKHPMEANTVVKEEDFGIKKVDSPSKEALRPVDKASLVGMETAQYVAEDTELRRAYFAPTKYRIGDETGKGIMALSSDWFLSYPQTVRRGDTVEVFKENTRIGKCIVAHARDGSNNEVVFSEGERMSGSGTVVYLEVIGDIATLLEISNEAASGTKFTLINLH